MKCLFFLAVFLTTGMVFSQEEKLMLAVSEQNLTEEGYPSPQYMDPDGIKSGVWHYKDAQGNTFLVRRFFNNRSNGAVYNPLASGAFREGIIIPNATIIQDGETVSAKVQSFVKESLAASQIELSNEAGVVAVIDREGRLKSVRLIGQWENADDVKTALERTAANQILVDNPLAGKVERIEYAIVVL